MTDPKMQGAPILRSTFCVVGTHMFVWSGPVSPDKPGGDSLLRCTCQAYTYKEWHHHPQEKKRDSAAEKEMP